MVPLRLPGAARMKRRRGRFFAQAFAEALRTVAQDYAYFVSGAGRMQPDEDPKLFGARHAAARSCLAHLEALLELIGEDAGLEPVRESFTLLHAAQRALALPAPGGANAPPRLIHDASDHRDDDD